ncbi:hypothetical protein V8D89_007945, partial [Ganoderma adspersum]
MPFGILEDHKLDIVPGTGLLSAKGNQLPTGDASQLKRGTGKYSHIVLIPQPSDDPRDPLNWPRWRKETCFWTLVYMSGLADTILFLANPGYFMLAKEFNVSVDEVASSFSASYAGNAVFLLLHIPISVKYGHRITYLLSALLLFISCVWVALSPDLTSIRVSRVFQGFGASAFRCLVANIIEQLYLGVLINGYVIQLLSWRFGFWFANIACGLGFVGVLLFVPETIYRRRASESPAAQDPASNNSRVEKTGSRTRTPDDVDPNRDMSSSIRSTGVLSYLRIYNGTFSDESMWRIFLGMFPFVLSPVTWFAFVSVSIPTVLLGFFAACSSTIFTVTYGFDAGQIGLTNLGSLAGILLAIVTAGPLNDWWVIWMSQRNGGIYEPEFRLVFTLSMLVGALSYMGWAIGNDNDMPWIGAVACLAMTYFSVVVSSATRVAYVIDVHGARASHIIALTESAMNVLVYGTTFFANRVVLSAGVERTLLVVAACQAACWLACVPVYVCGKRVRSFIARHPRLFRGD